MLRFTEGNRAGLSKIEINLKRPAVAKAGTHESGQLGRKSSTFTEQLEIINGFCS